MAAALRPPCEGLLRPSDPIRIAGWTIASPNHGSHGFSSGLRVGPIPQQCCRISESRARFRSYTRERWAGLRDRALFFDFFFAEMGLIAASEVFIPLTTRAAWLGFNSKSIAWSLSVRTQSEIRLPSANQPLRTSRTSTHISFCSLGGTIDLFAIASSLVVGILDKYS